MATEIETDVVVVGYGGAGAVAAITAHDAGARVVILEKMPAGGGNTRVSAGVIIDPRDMTAADYITSLSFGNTEAATVQAFVAEALENRRWLEGMGAQTESQSTVGNIYYPICPTPCWPDAPGASAMTEHFHVRPEGAARQQRGWFGGHLWNLLHDQVTRRHIETHLDTAARSLITADDGTVTGVVAGHGDTEVVVRAKRAVILTCGGFEYNEPMKRAFLPCQYFQALGNTGNTGDGIVMAQQAGAALWHMGAVASPLGFKAPGYEAAFDILMFSDRFIYVDRDARRFANETNLEMWRTICWFDSHRALYPRLPTWAIFDEVMRKKGPLAPKMGTNMDYDWSLDNSKEVSRGWIKKGKTLAQLAAQISLDATALEDTVARYNEACRGGIDAEFGRARDSLTPIDSGPYYAIELWPSLLNTMGGPRRDARARVLDHQDRPIPGLYAAGELGSLWGFLYEAAGNITECLAVGRIAGRGAAAEPSR